MEIEQALFSDLPEISVLQKLAFYDVGVYYRNFKLRPFLTSLEDFEKSFLEYLYLKATVGDRIVGSARAKMNNDKCKVENIIVHPAHQRKGIGKLLVTEIMNLLPEAQVFELFTGKKTTGNVAFYEGLGFSIVREVAETETEPVLVYMEKWR
ncbi:MAG: GNAT family N-acetyltransferase [Anaerolineaceae bacterium]|nr:GNAT family N-acetyltransferase [Anaerolineaceae bacterium]